MFSQLTQMPVWCAWGISGATSILLNPCETRNSKTSMIERRNHSDVSPSSTSEKAWPRGHKHIDDSSLEVFETLFFGFGPRTMCLGDITCLKSDQIHVQNFKGHIECCSPWRKLCEKKNQTWISYFCLKWCLPCFFCKDGPASVRCEGASFGTGERARDEAKKEYTWCLW